MFLELCRFLALVAKGVVVVADALARAMVRWNGSQQRQKPNELPTWPLSTSVWRTLHRCVSGAHLACWLGDWGYGLERQFEEPCTGGLHAAVDVCCCVWWYWASWSNKQQRQRQLPRRCVIFTVCLQVF